jgi:glycosyltransferase involved in cell wall biosynthesis
MALTLIEPIPANSRDPGHPCEPLRRSHLRSEEVTMTRLDLVIPVLNEAHVLEGSVERLRSYARGAVAAGWRVIIVDNGSTDGTDRVARRLAERHADVGYRRLEMAGRGRALRTIWSDTDADFSIYMDVDLSTELEAIPRVIEALESGADLVTGSRLHPESRIVRSLKREVLSRGYNLLIRAILGTRRFEDAQCGFKGVRLATIRPLLPLIENQNWFFDTELLVLAEYAGLHVESLPVRWIEDPDSRVNIVRTVLEDLRGLARLRRTAWNRTGPFRSAAPIRRPEAVR